MFTVNINQYAICKIWLFYKSRFARFNKDNLTCSIMKINFEFIEIITFDESCLLTSIDDNKEHLVSILMIDIIIKNCAIKVMCNENKQKFLNLCCTNLLNFKWNYVISIVQVLMHFIWRSSVFWMNYLKSGS